MQKLRQNKAGAENTKKENNSIYSFTHISVGNVFIDRQRV